MCPDLVVDGSLGPANVGELLATSFPDGVNGQNSLARRTVGRAYNETTRAVGRLVRLAERSTR